MNFAVASPSPRTAAAAPSRRIRVMLVDDAAVVRGLFARWVSGEPDLEVVASLRTGREAVNQLERADPDVVVLDVEMPELDGITALPLLLEKKRDLIVLMASTVTRRNAEISLRALSLGATDYIPKPTGHHEVTCSANFRRELIEKIRALGLRAKRFRQPPTVQAPPLQPQLRPQARGTTRPLERTVTAVQTRPLVSPREGSSASLALRPLPISPPRVLLIGCSTGGPQALNTIIPAIAGVTERAPVLITQHMPSTFTTILAEHLTRVAPRPVHEARDGEEINAGSIYLAPGGKHMRVARRDGTAVIAVDDGPLVNFCKPAVDPLFFSAAEIWGPKALALVLTGMGSDGLNGAKEIVASGGHVLAQDEATSIVWGMPGQVTNAGLCSAVLPLPMIAGKLTRLFAGERA